MSLFSELKRRSVFLAGAAYAAISWLIIQVVETTSPAFGFGSSAIRLMVIVLALGMVTVLTLAWMFELTPGGVRKDENVGRSHPSVSELGRKLDFGVIVLLLVALGFFVVDLPVSVIAEALGVTNIVEG